MRDRDRWQRRTAARKEVVGDRVRRFSSRHAGPAASSCKSLGAARRSRLREHRNERRHEAAPKARTVARQSSVREQPDMNRSSILRCEPACVHQSRSWAILLAARGRRPTSPVPRHAHGRGRRDGGLSRRGCFRHRRCVGGAVSAKPSGPIRDGTDRFSGRSVHSRRVRRRRF